jgi:hypothetical protein
VAITRKDRSAQPRVTFRLLQRVYLRPSVSTLPYSISCSYLFRISPANAILTSCAGQCLNKVPSGAKHPKLLDELATERILAAYSSSAGGECLFQRVRMCMWENLFLTETRMFYLAVSASHHSASRVSLNHMCTWNDRRSVQWILTNAHLIRIHAAPPILPCSVLLSLFSSRGAAYLLGRIPTA